MHICAYFSFSLSLIPLFSLSSTRKQTKNSSCYSWDSSWFGCIIQLPCQNKKEKEKRNWHIYLDSSDLASVSSFVEVVYFSPVAIWWGLKCYKNIHSFVAVIYFSLILLMTTFEDSLKCHFQSGTFSETDVYGITYKVASPRFLQPTCFQVIFLKGFSQYSSRWDWTDCMAEWLVT